MKKSPILITIDGVEIFNQGDICWQVDTTSFTVGKKIIVRKNIPGEQVYVYFSTEEMAEKYVLTHKPVFSLNDVMELPLKNLLDAATSVAKKRIKRSLHKKHS